MLNRGRPAPDYADLAERLEAAGADTSAAGTDGVICALCCAGRAELCAVWLAELLSAAPGDLLARECGELVVLHQTVVNAALDDPDFGFEPLLPSDEQPLAVRAEALVEWCAGFLHGLGLAEIAAGGAIPAEVDEAIRDLTEISRADYSVTGGQEDENAYAELVEYLRVAALLIHDELAAARCGAEDP